CGSRRSCPRRRCLALQTLGPFPVAAIGFGAHCPSRNAATNAGTRQRTAGGLSVSGAGGSKSENAGSICKSSSYCPFVSDCADNRPYRDWERADCQSTSQPQSEISGKIGGLQLFGPGRNVAGESTVWACEGSFHGCDPRSGGLV